MYNHALNLFALVFPNYYSGEKIPLQFRLIIILIGNKPTTSNGSVNVKKLKFVNRKLCAILATIIINLGVLGIYVVRAKMSCECTFGEGGLHNTNKQSNGGFLWTCVDGGFAQGCGKNNLPINDICHCLFI